MPSTSENSEYPVASGNPSDEQEGSRRRVRERRPTEKGSEYIRNLRLHAVISAKRAWRKQINSIHSLLATRKDIATLAAGCENLEKKMSKFSETHEALEALIENEDERKQTYEEFEVISCENNDVLRMVSDRIKSLEQEQDSNSSALSRSTKTSKVSSRSSRRSSHTSTRSSLLSMRQKRVQLEGDIASLRATMALAKERQEKEVKHRAKMDEVQRNKMEIAREEERAKEEFKALEENFRIKQELVQKEARMIASIRQEHILDEIPTKPPMEIESRGLMEKFLCDQYASVSNPLISTPSQPPIVSIPRAPVCEHEEGTAAPPETNFGALNPFSQHF